MTRICVSPRYVALRFSHIVPSAPGTAAAIRRVLRAEGFKPWPEADAEVFSLGGDTLVIARMREKCAARADSTE